MGAAAASLLGDAYVNITGETRGLQSAMLKAQHIVETGVKTLGFSLVTGVLAAIPLAIGTAVAGIVRFFCILSGTIHLRPVPNGNLSPVHYYRASETVLSGNGDVPLMPAQYHEAIVEAATAVALERRGATAEAAERRKYAMEWIENMRQRADRYSESTGGGAQPAEAAK
jgi:hypothetical protein